MPAAGDGTGPAAGGLWWVLADRAGVGEGIGRALERAGHRTAVLAAEESLERLAAGGEVPRDIVQTFTLSRGSREHALLFLQRLCQGCGQDSKTFFAKVNSPGNAEDALDEVADGAVRATVVDGVTLECYKRRKPGRHHQPRGL